MQPSPDPVANFKASVTDGPSPLYVQFTDLSENAAEIEWDFDDDGEIDSTDKSRVFVYTTPGTNTARLTASNENGTDSKTIMIIVKENNEDNIRENNEGSTAGSGAGDYVTVGSGTGNEELTGNEPGSDKAGERGITGNEPDDSESTGNSFGDGKAGDDVTGENTGSKNAKIEDGGSSPIDNGNSGSENSGNINIGSGDGAGNSPEPVFIAFLRMRSILPLISG